MYNSLLYLTTAIYSLNSNICIVTGNIAVHRCIVAVLRHVLFDGLHNTVCHPITQKLHSLLNIILSAKQKRSVRHVLFQWLHLKGFSQTQKGNQNEQPCTVNKA